MKDKGEHVKNQSTDNQHATTNMFTTGLDKATSEGMSPAAQSIEMSYIQSLLPERERVFAIVDYHERCMSYWVGGI
jgi:hypothetical protein